jgi:hypothetical protein
MTLLGATMFARTSALQFPQVFVGYKQLEECIDRTKYEIVSADWKNNKQKMWRMNQKLSSGIYFNN